MNTVISNGSRVQVRVHKNGYYKRTFNGTCKGWTDGGKCRVHEDGTNETKAYNSDYVKLIK